jgi:Tfp pilus assembly protein PilF
VKRYTANKEAYQLYLRARFYWATRSNEGFRRALEYFEQAISIEPGYALAHAGLADCYAVMSFFGSAPAKEILAKARASALKALEFDRHLPEALAVVAFCKAACEGSWAEAEQDFREAARAHPDCWQLHDYFGLFLSALGRYDEGLAEMERAKELEPLITLVKVHAIWILALARRYDPVINECSQIVELDLNYPMTHLWLGIAYGQKSRHEEAVRAMENFVRLSPGMTVAQASLGNALALAGREQEARSVLAELLAISESRYLEPYGVALIYTALREPDAAFEWLAKAFEDRSGWLGMYVMGDPRLDPLRSDPRFRDLLQRMNLAPVSQ